MIRACTTAILTTLALQTPSKNINFEIETKVPRQEVFFASDLYGWEDNQKMTEASPGLYTLSLKTPWLHSLQYKFIVDGKWIHDPRTQEKTDDNHGGYNSVRKIDFKEDPLLERGSDTPAMERAVLSLVDKEGAQREIYVSSPQVKSQKRWAVVYFHDGLDYLQKTGAENLLANLSLEKEMPNLVGVFIPPKDRMREYGQLDSNNPYVAFLADVVVPSVEKKLGLKLLAQDRLLIGASMGGLISVFTGLERSEVFSQVASESGSLFHRKSRVVELLGKSQAALKIYLDSGLYEDMSLVKSNHAGFQSARSAGLAVMLREYPSTHDWIAWRNRLQFILRNFFQGNADY